MNNSGLLFYCEKFLFLTAGRTIKYEDMYPKAYETPKEARTGIHNYIKFYNHERPHSRLKYRTPEEIYRDRNYPVSPSCVV